VTDRRDPLPTDVHALPPLPPGYHAVVDAGLGRLGLELPPTVRAAVDDHVRLLLAWTAAINLTAIRDPEAVAREHVLDSLAAVPLLRARRIRSLLDLGSGGGFPGLPLAVALPAERALLVESVLKKARFLSTAATALGVASRVGVGATRAETLAADPRHRGRWPAVTARAVAGLAELVEIALPLLAPGGVLVAWKRAPLDEEQRRAEGALRALGGRAAEVWSVEAEGLADHRLVVVEKVHMTPPAYPRDPAVRKQRPW
jgi:16S rRNA (guanine527-N7)-methyltransferase